MAEANASPLGRKIGPLPLGAWIVIGASGLVVGYILRRRAPGGRGVERADAPEVDGEQQFPQPATYYVPVPGGGPPAGPPPPPAPEPIPPPPTKVRLGSTFEYMCKQWRRYRTLYKTPEAFVAAYNPRHATNWTAADVRRCG